MFSKDIKQAFRMINARSETLFEKPSFKNLILRRRCIIPSDGIYEWQKIDDKKQPIRIMLRSGDIFSMAGLHDTWTNNEGEAIHSCTIITTTPNALFEPIHDRMPVILPKDRENDWLDTKLQDSNYLKHLLVPYPHEEMRAYPVSSLVGNVRNDVPACIEPSTVKWLNLPNVIQV